MPDEAALLDLHRRLLAGDPVAPAALAELVLGPLVRALQAGVGRKRDEAFVVDAVTDAVLDFAQRAATYDAAKGSVASFLVLAARRNLANRIVSEGRHAGRVQRYRPVAESLAARNKTTVSPHELLAEAELNRRRLEDLAPGLDGLSAQEQAVLRLIVGGERDTARLAAAMGISNLPRGEQQKLVKRVRDRLLKRLRRLAPGDPNG